MTTTAAPVTQLFRDFFAVVTALQRQIELTSPTGTVSIEETKQPLREFLANIGSAQTNASASSAATGAGALKQVQYALAGFADERFINLDWPGRDPWRASTLESEFFQTNEAGVEVFRRIAKLLETGDPGNQPIGRLYLMLLLFGFRGQLRDVKAARTIGKLQAQLLTFAVPQPTGTSAPTVVTPGAYAHTLGGGTAVRLPAVRGWTWIAAAAVLALLIVTYWRWTALTLPVAHVVQRILSGGGAP